MKKDLDLSIICCYNNEKQLNEQLLESYRNQNCTAELVLIDNTSNEFQSAASALNYGAKLSTKNYFIFVHQDIIFTKIDSLQNIFNYIKTCDNSILGVAGVKYNSSKIVSTIVEGKNQKRIGEDFDEPIEVHTLDECLIGCSKNTFLKFDEQACDNWHLYVVDLCLESKKQGIKILCIPSDIWHFSGGKINDGFYVTLKRLVKKHKNNYKYISTTCITVNTSLFALKGNVYVRHWKFKKGRNKQ